MILKEEDHLQDVIIKLGLMVIFFKFSRIIIEPNFYIHAGK